MNAPDSPLQDQNLKHSHIFNEGNPLAEKKTLKAVILTAFMMVIEIIGGWFFNSMALLADGWHMSSHALALGLSVMAYKAARHFATDHRFTFGTWKIEVLGGYTSAIFLVLVALLMLYQSLEHLLAPTSIRYDEAIGIAVIGLLVNFVCAWLLRDDHSHHHNDHEHRHHHDVNLRSAYLHVVADAATSVLAIAALFGGKYWGIRWLDPVMGIIGAVLVAVWAYGLLRDTGRMLLDVGMNDALSTAIHNTIQHDPVTAHISDLHLWQVGKGKYACILSLSVEEDVSPQYFKKQLDAHPELAHVTIEVNK